MLPEQNKKIVVSGYSNRELRSRYSFTSNSGPGAFEVRSRSQCACLSSATLNETAMQVRTVELDEMGRGAALPVVLYHVQARYAAATAATAD
jgi:hypothetical protein